VDLLLTKRNSQQQEQKVEKEGEIKNELNSSGITHHTQAAPIRMGSVKSRNFQLHIRKLLEIALEMLQKSQVPSVQYIALSTINRIFDIYVYHELFYPGYYESCYIPIGKRQLNKQQPPQTQQSELTSGLMQMARKFRQVQNDSADANKKKSVSVLLIN
jgi:hypothetical protein